MATKLIEVCDLCKKEYDNGIQDINHMKQSNIVRFVVIAGNGGFSIHVEVCKLCIERFTKQLNDLFLTNKLEKYAQ